MRRFGVALVTIFLMAGLVPGSVAAANGATVFTDQATFVSTTHATAVDWPTDASTALPNHPWGTTYNDYSCTTGSISLAGTVTVTGPSAGSTLCFLGADWNAGLANTNPTPTGPTIVVSGEDDYTVTLTFAQPRYAVGFGLLTNLTASESVTLHYADGTTQTIPDSALGTAPNSFAFVGFKNNLTAITSVDLNTTGGATQNEGITGIWTAGDIVPSGEIVSPAADAVFTPGTDVLFHAYYYDDNPGSIAWWAVRLDGTNTTCAHLYDPDNQYAGNVDGDNTPATWTDTPGGKEFNATVSTTGWPAGEYCFVFNPGAADNTPSGEYDVRLVRQFFVDNPPVANPGGPYLVQVGGTVTFDGSGSSDPDGDALTYAWTVAGGTLDDSTAVAPTFTAGSTPGVYNVSLTVTDPYGLFDTATTSVVVYDPSGGFVTGGGWISSPAGAYADDPTLAGKATFGFVSKYQKGASVPSGNTEFQFQVAGLNFHSTSYQWLVVNQNGTNAQFKGTGTINGTGTYGFMIRATDGSPDTFRIQITDGDTTVYDNGVQSIGGGSIVVHAS